MKLFACYFPFFIIKFYSMAFNSKNATRLDDDRGLKHQKCEEVLKKEKLKLIIRENMLIPKSNSDKNR